MGVAEDLLTRRALQKEEKKDDLNVWFEWGKNFAVENKITQEESEKLLKQTRKNIHENCD